jgi:large subunit ribosomal protein L30
MLRIKLVKSLIGQKPVTKENIKALGLGKISSVIERNDTPSLRGMLHRVRHMVTVEEVEGEVVSNRSKRLGAKTEAAAPKKATKKKVAKEEN